MTAAKAHGIYTVLDMHQDAWGNALARPSAQCGGGTTPDHRLGRRAGLGDITDGTAHCQFMARDLAPAVATAFENFYTDRDGIQGELVRTWAFVARAVRRRAGGRRLRPAQRARHRHQPADQLRAAAGRLLRRRDHGHPAGRARRRRLRPPRLLRAQRAVVRPRLRRDSAAGFTDDRQLVFAPHPYSESISMDQSFGLTIASIERNLDRLRPRRRRRTAPRCGPANGAGSATRRSTAPRCGASAPPRTGSASAARSGCGGRAAARPRPAPTRRPPATWSRRLPHRRVDPAAGGLRRTAVEGLPAGVPGPAGLARLRPATATCGSTRRPTDDPANCRFDVWVPGDHEAPR